MSYSDVSIMAIKKQSQYGEEFDRWCDENYVDPNDPDIKYYYEDFIDEKMQNAYDEQESASDPIQALLELYRQYEEKDSEQERVANDPEAMQWLKDYWAFTCWNNHGNQASLEEIGGFVGMQYTFSDVDNVIEALSSGGEDYDTLDDDQKDLIDRFKSITGRYGYMSKTSKSTDINSMIAQIRNNNNSLVKSRVDIGKNLRSVGSIEGLNIDRISDEMLQYIIDSRQPNGDYALDECDAYMKWEDNNYEIRVIDEYGDQELEPTLFDMLETKFIKYREQREWDIMDTVLDLEYNDLIRIDGREVYVKSSNGQDTYNGCMLWCGPSEDDDRGWYFRVSDFEEVITPSNSGERLFG